MLNICNVLHSLLVTSCVIKDEQQKELEKECNKDQEIYFKILKDEENLKLSTS